MGKSTISMAIFNSYVKLPEGMSDMPGPNGTFFVGKNDKSLELDTLFFLDKHNCVEDNSALTKSKYPQRFHMGLSENRVYSQI